VVQPRATTSSKEGDPFGTAIKSLTEDIKRQKQEKRNKIIYCVSMASAPVSLSGLSPQEVRQRIRTGEWTRPTSGLCLGYQQAKYAAPHQLITVPY
jgi:hypothetical protein